MVVSTQDDKKAIGIIGGGNAGCELLGLFNASQETRVAFVMDINPSAPAMLEARKCSLKTFTDLSAALTEPVDFLIEVTGNDKVVKSIKTQITGTPVLLITNQMARLMINALNENNHKTKAQVVQEITGIGGQIDQSLSSIRDLVTSIEDITAQMNILAINARIEAARVGSAGASFAVVASAMGESAEKVKEITGQISQVNAAIEDTSQKINISLRALQ
jgi:methyl-accepting chemotaxis protein